MQYPFKSKKLEIAAGATVTFELPPQSQPFESLTFVAQVLLPSGSNVDLTPMLSGKDITAKAIATVADNTPRVITIDGIFPANKLPASPGIVPGFKVKNNGAAKVAVHAYILARSAGPGVG